MNATLMILGFICFYLLLIWKSNKTYALFYLFFFTYFLQYVFAPYFVYNEYDVLSYQMPIEQERYFNYTVPALFFLFSGVALFMKDIRIRPLLKRIDRKEAARFGYLLLGISLGFDLIELVGINAFSSIASFTTYFKYLAAFCFLFGRTKFNYFLVGIIYLQLAIKVLGAGVFISFLIWGTFLFFFITLIFRFPFWLRASAIMIAIPVTVMIQSVKKEYRELTWEGEHEGGVRLFTELAEKNKEDEKSFTETKGMVSTMGRLSQGWHLGLALKHVPQRQDFANGKELLIDVISSILPRVIFSGKKEVNDQKKFLKYTGHRLRGSTSMSIGVLGDFYINFAVWGSFIMLFVFGALIAKLSNFFYRRYVIPDPINIIWIPFMLSYLIRANNDFYIFFNCLIKGFIIFLMMNYARHRLLRPRRKPVTPILKQVPV
jgi:hypothetical protein